ncbi:squamosa promoter-binding-like protein 9 [Iris pallida]|uniref:Squamosa promoter-binding-like protein 9 n=1 Tax=Iris pallida TaxID=29817 RepID=A0AAX6FYP0_IRIPA|nr:squamosa promoter-binding-like protein 9 [Iris pallida]
MSSTNDSPPPPDSRVRVSNMEDASSLFDWNAFLDFSLDDLDLPVDSPPPPLPPPPAPSRVRKRDPRLVCENFLAGRVPCACPEVDAMMAELEEDDRAAADDGGRKKLKSGATAAAAAAAKAEIRCQVAGCEADIRELKGYHRRHRVCLRCAAASSVAIDGADRRYCQQCGKFHLLADFDEGKRSCRRKLERHNRRRRRNPTESVSIMENEKRPERDHSVDVTCDGVLREEGKFVCEAVESVLINKVIDREILLESENGHGSPVCLLPSSQNDQNNIIVSSVVSGEAHVDEGKENPNSSISSTVCDNKSTYSSVCPTGRISFKLYDWNPAEFPRRLRHQIFQWLGSMPVELEGYIRPGCTILTIFIAMPRFMWEKLSQDAYLHIKDLVNAPESLFLGRGNVFIYLNNMIIHLLRDGTSLVNIKMEVKAPKIHYVHPTYFEAGKPMEFVACGSNLDQPKFRFLVSFAGNYLVYDSCHAISHGKRMSCGGSQSDSFHDSDHEMFRIRVSQTDSKLIGPAFIEVENDSGISNFIPVLFGNKQICSEVERMQGELIESLCADSLLPHVAVPGACPGFCELFVSRHTAMSELITDIAWLLKEHHTDTWEAVASLTNIQRLICLLKFTIQNELFAVLDVILQYVDATVGIWQKFENVVPDADLKLLLDYINSAKEILNKKALLDSRSGLDSGRSIQKILVPQSIVIGTKNKDVEARNRDGMCSASPLASEEGDENVPLVSKDMIDREQRHYQQMNEDWNRWPWVNMHSSTFSGTRLSVFVMVSVVICLAACIVFVHPLETEGLVVSIRRRLFGYTLP